jgi:hypothetical protein
MSFRAGDRSRANRLRRQKLKRRETIAALKASYATSKPESKKKVSK